MTKKNKIRFDRIIEMITALRKSRLTSHQKVINLRSICQQAAFEMWRLVLIDKEAREEVLDQIPNTTNAILNLERQIYQDCK